MEINYTISLSKDDLKTLAQMVYSKAQSYNTDEDEKRVICDEVDVDYY